MSSSRAMFAEEGLYEVKGAQIGDEVHLGEGVYPLLVVFVAKRGWVCKDRESSAGRLSTPDARYEDSYGFNGNRQCSVIRT